MAQRVYTEDEVEDLVARALKKVKHPDFNQLKEWQDLKILAKELTHEKRHRVLKAETVDEQLDALGGPTALSPHQLLKMSSRRAIEAGDTVPAETSLFQQVLGEEPSSDHLARLREVQKNLKGKGVGMTKQGEIEIDGEVVPGSDMVKSLCYIVKGTQGVRLQPPGVKEIAQILKSSGVASSRFPPTIQLLLKNKQAKKKSPLKPPSLLRSSVVNFTPARGATRKRPDTDDEVDNLAQNLNSNWTLQDRDQKGSGLELSQAQLNAACDHADCSDFDFDDAKKRGA